MQLPPRAQPKRHTYTRHSRLLDIQADLQRDIMREKEAKLLRILHDNEEKKKQRLARFANNFQERNDSAPIMGSARYHDVHRVVNSADRPKPSANFGFNANGTTVAGRKPQLKPIEPLAQRHHSSGGLKPREENWQGSNLAPTERGGIPRPLPIKQHKYQSIELQKKNAMDLERRRLIGERRRRESEYKREAERKQRAAEAEAALRQQQEHEQIDEHSNHQYHGNGYGNGDGNRQHQTVDHVEEEPDEDQQAREALIAQLERDQKRKLRELNDMKERHKEEQRRRFGRLADKFSDGDDEEEPINDSAVSPGHHQPTRIPKQKPAKAFHHNSRDDHDSYGDHDAPAHQSSTGSKKKTSHRPVWDSSGVEYPTPEPALYPAHQQQEADGVLARDTPGAFGDAAGGVKEEYKPSPPSHKNNGGARRQKPSGLKKPKRESPTVIFHEPKRKEQPITGFQSRSQPTEIIDEETGERKTLVSCAVCERKFAEDRIDKHQAACSKKKTRKQFDPTKQRLAGSGAEAYLERKGKKAAAQKQAPKSKGNWRAKHKEFIDAIRYAKKMSQYEAEGGNILDLPPPPPAENPDYIQCPHCARRFNQQAGERHIPRCKDIKAKPKTLLRKR